MRTEKVLASFKNNVGNTVSLVEATYKDENYAGEIGSWVAYEVWEESGCLTDRATLEDGIKHYVYYAVENERETK